MSLIFPLSQDIKLKILRSIDKYDRLGEQGIFDLLTKGRKDESGAFIDGVGLSNSQANIILYFIKCGKDNNSNKETLNKIALFFYVMHMPKEELNILYSKLENLGLIDES